MKKKTKGFFKIKQRIDRVGNNFNNLNICATRFPEGEKKRTEKILEIVSGNIKN